LDYDGVAMMVRIQVTLENEVHKRVRRRASEAGVSLAEYLRRMVERDLARPQTRSDITAVFDLGRSTGSDIAAEKDSAIGGAFRSAAIS